jgi:predicted PurR-regulated permease PerM/serine phosphatase RsbU (regulator of sigma subunit)
MVGSSEGAAQTPAFGPDEPAPHDSSSHPLATVGVVAAAIAALYFLQEVFIPIALAVLLSFMLGPAVTRLRRWGIGRIPSTLVIVLLAGLMIAGITTVVAFQILDLASNITTYQYNLITKIRQIKGTPGQEGVVERTSRVIENLSQELANAAGSTEDKKAAQQPIPVEVHTPKPNPLAVISHVIGPLLGPVAKAGMVVIFVIFILLYREDLRDRIIRLVSSGDLQRATEAMSQAGQRVSRYLLMQLVVNTTYGLPIGIGLFFIGVPNPVLWGLLATILRFIPYAGPMIGAAFPVALSFAVDPGWTMPLLTIGLFLGIELIVGNAIEPWLYGASTGISAIAILIAAVFWTWLWGPIGLLLSTPLTVCLVVIGRFVPQLRFLDVMLGDRPVLPPSARFYQRLLAHDPDEAAEITEEFIQERSLEELYDDLILPALVLAENDRQRGSLTPDRLSALVDSAYTIIEDYADWKPAEDKRDSDKTAAPVVSQPTQLRSEPVLCVGARSKLDELAAAMLAQLLQRRGFPVARAAASTLERNDLPAVSGLAVKVVAICSLHPSAPLQIRRIVRRLRPKLAGARVVAALFHNPPEEGRTTELTPETTADVVVMRLSDAVAQIENLTTPPADAEQAGLEVQAQPAKSESSEQELAQGLRRTLLHPVEIDEPQAHLCHAYWQAPDGGGDFIESRRRDDGTLIAVMAALSSESVSAALLTAAMRKSVDDHFEAAEDPAELLNLVERDVGNLAPNGEVIAAIALFYRLERHLLHVASAGSPEPILMRGETVEPFPVPVGPPLLSQQDPAVETPERRNVDIALKPGDRILFYTEGAIEATHPERGFLEPVGLAQIAMEHRGFAGMTFLEHLINDIRAFGEGEPEDDIVLLTLEVRDNVPTQKLPDAAD